MTTLLLEEFVDVCITVPWGHISGRWYGNREVRPILAIHGWQDNLGTFDKLIPFLPAHVGVLCIDLPGHGRSSHFPSGIRYTVEHYIVVIPIVMKEYNWTRVSLLGHSLGAVLSFLFTSVYPDKVDMMISIDTIHPLYNIPTIENMATNVEKLLIDDERIAQMKSKQPPMYNFAKLEEIVYIGSYYWVDQENAKHLLHRNISKSELYPDKFYFSRDNRLKYLQYFSFWPAFGAEMARRIKNKPYLVIKGGKSGFITDSSDEVISILRAQNPHFQFHVLDGTHYLHLNNPAACARVIVPFIHRFRPTPLNSWSIGEQITNPEARRKAQERFVAWKRRLYDKHKPKNKL